MKFSIAVKNAAQKGRRQLIDQKIYHLFLKLFIWFW